MRYQNVNIFHVGEWSATPAEYAADISDAEKGSVRFVESHHQPLIKQRVKKQSPKKICYLKKKKKKFVTASPRAPDSVMTVCGGLSAVSTVNSVRTVHSSQERKRFSFFVTSRTRQASSFVLGC